MYIGNKRLLGAMTVLTGNLFLRYSENADGTDFTETWHKGQNYIGIAAAIEEPTDKDAYNWIELVPSEVTEGTDGVGIVSIEQTTTSTVDGGTNIITVTLSNGTTSTFAIKNGSKGSKGDSYVLTEADKAEMKEYIDEQLGDIDAALDSIIAIQNSLIGAFTFDIEYRGYEQNIYTVTAERGMTWKDWVYSEYNPDWLLYDDGGDLLCNNGDEIVYNSRGERQTLSDIIDEREFYYIE